MKEFNKKPENGKHFDFTESTSSLFQLSRTERTKDNGGQTRLENFRKSQCFTLFLVKAVIETMAFVCYSIDGSILIMNTPRKENYCIQIVLRCL